MTRYGMVIDLSRCTGCRSCMVACKVENNTAQGNFWMYAFRFEEGEFPNTRVWFMPRPCMHCQNAACVKVCPVGARYKREDGLTATDWERCIGCRYCEVACPYGVNYFNWKDPNKSNYLDWDDPDVVAITGGGLPYDNPDLEEAYGDENRRIAGGGHDKGVMEKCTFCVHRVEQGQIDAKNEGRDLEDGDIVVACQQACPTDAISFGNINDPNSEVSKVKAQNRDYALLGELNLQPRTSYGAKLRNPNPALEARS
ncbi:MAG: 4Fe-4S dicluster domain-containing protein [Anaerolineales bacterium]|nr:4Fe-4S dicluster domain-containing protein [Anaerolineales bacterium]